MLNILKKYETIQLKPLQKWREKQYYEQIKRNKNNMELVFYNIHSVLQQSISLRCPADNGTWDKLEFQAK